MGSFDLFADAGSDIAAPGAGTAIVIDAVPLPDYLDKVEMCEATFNWLYEQGYHVVFSYSSGKDSSVLLSIGLEVARRRIAADLDVPEFAIIHGNTRLENPEINRFALSRIGMIEAFMREHKLPGRCVIAMPEMSRNHMINLIGGRTIASMPDTDAKCSADMKITPIGQAKREVFKSFGKTAKIVSCIGTRFEESDERFRNMVERGENWLRPVEINGSLVISPIATFELDDVWMYIGEVRNNRRHTYDDFERLIEVYRDGEGGLCAVIAYMDGQTRTAGCGARFGCWACNRVGTDKSMENMLKEDRYAYMRPLNQFRQWIRDTHYDPARRSWLSRKVADDGTVKIAPNAYSPQHCEEMLWIALTIQAEEIEQAKAAGIEPRFTILSEADVVGIDILWGRYGYHRDLRACTIYKRVMLGGERYPVPTIPEDDIFTELPRVKGLSVPFADSEYDRPEHGLRDPVAMADGTEETITKKDGVVYTNVRAARFMKVDEAAAAEFFQSGLDEALAAVSNTLDVPAAGFWHLARTDMFAISNAGHRDFDRMLKMGNQIWRHGIRDCLNDPTELANRLYAIFDDQAGRQAHNERLEAGSDTEQQGSLF